MEEVRCKKGEEMTNYSPLVSIIINNYNYAQYLGKAIDSALMQTYGSVEVIVVDDGSTDKSLPIINGYGQRLVSISKSNGGQASTLNSGYFASSGEVILFLDADDYLFPDAVEEIVNVWHSSISKVHYRLNVVDSDERFLGYTYPRSDTLASGNVLDTLLSKATYVTVPTSGNAIARTALDKIFPIPEDKFKIAADNYMTALVPFYGNIAAIEKPLAAYRLHDDNRWVSATFDEGKFRKYVQHDMLRDELLLERSNQLGYEIPKDFELRFFGRFWSRLASLRLNPYTHPIASDTRLGLACSGINSLWKYSNLSLLKKLTFSLWFLWVSAAPISLAKLAITWLFAPRLRPKIITHTLSKIRAFRASQSNETTTKA